MAYQTKIGLEIHIHLKSHSKLFCGCSTEFGAGVNSQTCPVCLGLPGSLPVFNQKALDLGIKAALGLNCEISDFMRFDRKHYFYPDLPKNFQISQYEIPLAKNGHLDIRVSPRSKIRIRRAHLEEDAGKLIHKQDCSYVDYNRGGIPLLEIVTEPDLNSPEEAYNFLIELKTLLQYLEVSNCDMEKGELRCDANISIQEGEKIGDKVEIKNLNSFKMVKEALLFEEKRQKGLLKQGEKVIQETRLWDDTAKKTISMRKKEESFDYRYFPEPDLPPFVIEKNKIEEIRAALPELPCSKRERFKKEYGLKDEEIEIFIQNKNLANFFENTISELKMWMIDAKISEKKLSSLRKLTANYLISDLSGLIAEKGIGFQDLKITPENFAELMVVIEKGEVSSRTAKDVLKIMFQTGADPSNIIKERGLKKIANDKEMEEIVRKVIEENPQTVSDFKKGKQNALEFLLGKIMAKTKGTADPAKSREILKKMLANDQQQKC